MPARSPRLGSAQLVPPDNLLWLKGLSPSFCSVTSERINVAQKRLYKRCWCGCCFLRPPVSAHSRGPPRGVLSVRSRSTLYLSSAVKSLFFFLPRPRPSCCVGLTSHLLTGSLFFPFLCLQSFTPLMTSVILNCRRLDLDCSFQTP